MCVLAGASVCNTCVCAHGCAHTHHVHTGVHTDVHMHTHTTHVRTPHSRLGVDAGVRSEHKRG